METAMSNYGYEVPARSWAEIDDITESMRRKFGVLSNPYFDIVKLIETGMSDKLRMFDIEYLLIAEMPDKYAEVTTCGKVLRIRQDTYVNACAGRGQARFTLAHELGHLILHCGKTGVYALASGQKVPGYSDSEAQANFFAATLLMPSKFFSKQDSVQSVMHRHGVSASAARNRLSYLSSKGKLKWKEQGGLFS
jgi:Zn-dependent peptidase ImmA (M78 family)